MNEQQSLLEHLSSELFRLIFEYLAPHELIRAFKKLNKRFTAMLAEQPLCLPNNRHMNCELYFDYITKIVPKHSSQMVYLHLSERRTPHAVNWFVSEVPFDTLTWPKLKAITIEDVPHHLFELLLGGNSLWANIHSFTLDISHKRYHHSEYNRFADHCIVIPILNSMPELRSLYLHIGHRLSQNYVSTFDQYCPRMETAPVLFDNFMKCGD